MNKWLIRKEQYQEHPHPHPFLPRAPDRVLQVAHTPGAAESHLHRLYGPRVRQDGARGLFPLLVRARTDVKATSASISCRSCFERQDQSHVALPPSAVALVLSLLR